MTDTAAPRITLIASRSRTRAALARWLAAIAPGSHVAAFAGTADLLGRANAAADLDLVAVAFDPAAGATPRRSLLDTVARLHAALPGKPILIVSLREEAAVPVAEAIRRGARAYIPASLNRAAATAALGLVLTGGTFVPAGALLGQPKDDGAA